MVIVSILQTGNQGLERLTNLSNITQLGSQDFCRLRCGIGHPPGQMEVIDFVLNKFSKEDSELLPLVLDKAASCVLDFVTQGYTWCMNHYNGPVVLDDRR